MYTATKSNSTNYQSYPTQEYCVLLSLLLYLQTQACLFVPNVAYRKSSLMCCTSPLTPSFKFACGHTKGQVIYQEWKTGSLFCLQDRSCFYSGQSQALHFALLQNGNAHGQLLHRQEWRTFVMLFGWKVIRGEERPASRNSYTHLLITIKCYCRHSLSLQTFMWGNSLFPFLQMGKLW